MHALGARWVALRGVICTHRAHAGLEVEQSRARNPEPVGEIVSVGERCREPNDADGPRGVGGDVVEPRHDDLKHRATVGAQQVDLVNDNKPNLVKMEGGLVSGW
jgi:hypothetical protein